MSDYKVIHRVQDGYSYAGITPDIEVHLCGNCGIMWGAPADWFERRREDGKTFYCPNGCARVYRETEKDRLQRQLEQEQRRVARLMASEDQLRAEVKQVEARRRATKAVLTKTRNRIASTGNVPSAPHDANITCVPLASKP